MKKQLNGDNGRLLILEVTIGDAEYRLANIYNANTEQFQLKTLDKFQLKALITSITKTRYLPAT